MYPIPDQVCEQFNQAAMSTEIGIFAEIRHAWIAVDHAFYMWDYTVPDAQPHGYEECKSKITAVQLCVPKRGVFLDSITHVIVLADLNEITLLAMGKMDDGKGFKAWKMFRSNMSTSVKGLNISYISSSTDTGRIFFTGSNIDVWELQYQNEEGWFSNRCGKVNHTSSTYAQIVPSIWGQRTEESVKQITVDDTRRLLYTLSNQSKIRVYHMDSTSSLRLVIEKSRRQILEDISHMSNSPLLTNDTKIISIDSISSVEATRLHLMATTNTGCRIFLSATRGYRYSSSGDAPTSMQVQHIRFPPSLDQSRRQENEQAVDVASNVLSPTKLGARFAPGYFFCIVPNRQTVAGEELFVSVPDTGRIAKQSRDNTPLRYYESSAWFTLPDQTIAVGLVSAYFAATRTPQGFGNELAVQFDNPITEIAVLTATGVHVFSRRRLVDVFASAIRSSNNEEALEVELRKFMENYGRGETTATALAVACGQGADNHDGRRIGITDTAEAARKAFVDHGGRPTVDENAVTEGLSSMVDRVRPSARHEGMALYMARLVRSLWKATVVRESANRENGNVLVSPTVSVEKLRSTQDELSKLRTFLQQNTSFIDGLSGPEALQRAATRKDEFALQGEHQAFQSLQVLNDRIIEGISFVQVLFEERVDQIWQTLSPTTRQALRDLTYERLFASNEGRDLAKVLVKSIVHRNIANGSNVDTVAEALRRRCGSFCSPDDVIIFKAQEQLQKAHDTGGSSNHDRHILNESLRLFQQVARSLTMQNLHTAVEQFTKLRFFAGAIKLALLVASESDRGRTAEAWILAGQPRDDSRRTKWEFRRQCYDLVHKVLLEVDAISSEECQPDDGQPNIDVLKQREAYALVDDSNDEIFHKGLYDWYLENGEQARLLSVASPFIIPYLESIAANDVSNADLLWKYHVQHDDFFKAAEVQVSLAKSDFEITLAARIQYLSRAKANASTTSGYTGRAQRQLLLHEINELLEVANIQDELLQRLLNEPRMTDKAKKETVIRDLDGVIRDITMVCNSTITPFRM